jgi:MoaA/NifB/PqqE/SkfB family radical SAM enzyme
MKLFCAKTFKIRTPVVAYLLITDKCNMRCRYCFVDCSKKKEELSTPEWLGLIDELAKRGVRQICLMGGEPTLHPDFETIVDKIVSLGISCDTTTNGVLAEKKLSAMKKLNSVMVSLDGSREAHDSNRKTTGGGGTFDTTLNAIKLLRKEGVTTRINAVMTKQSAKDIDFLLGLAEELDLYVTFSLTADFPEHAQNEADEIMLSPDEIRQLYRDLKKRNGKDSRILFSNEALDFVINYPLPHKEVIWKEDKEHASFYPHVCPFGRAMFYVDSDGGFFPCATLWNSPRFKPVNYRKEGFDAAFNGMEPLPCRTCFCPGIPDWNRVSSAAGFLDGLRITLRQALK